MRTEVKRRFGTEQVTMTYPVNRDEGWNGDWRRISSLKDLKEKKCNFEGLFGPCVVTVNGWWLGPINGVRFPDYDLNNRYSPEGFEVTNIGHKWMTVKGEQIGIAKVLLIEGETRGAEVVTFTQLVAC